MVLLTEVATYGSSEGLDNFEEAMSETNPERLYVYESTAKGFNHWRDRWLAAKGDSFTKRCIFVGWWAKDTNIIPQRDPRFQIFGLTEPDEREREKIAKVKEWYGWTITAEQLAWIRWRSSGSQTEASLNQNQPWTEAEAFVMSGKSYFQTRLIAADYERIGGTEDTPAIQYVGSRFWFGKDFWSTTMENLRGDPLRRQEVELRTWQAPMKEGRYVIGCDPAGGSDDKNDRHAIEVYRCYADKLVQVAEYADNIAETKHCAWVLAYLAGVYKNCIINLEGRFDFHSYIDHIRDMLRADMNRERKSMKGESWEDFLDNARYYIYRRPDSPASAGYILHFMTTGDNKRMIFNEFRDAHVNQYLVVNSKPLLEEMQIIVQDGSEIGAPNKQKDDRCFASCLATHAWVQHERPGLLMMGETFAAVEARESGERNDGGFVNRIVSQYLKEIESPVQDMTPAQLWMSERGLQ